METNGPPPRQKAHVQAQMEPPTPIAIVGMACRLPGGVSDLESFWDFCQKARNAWTDFPKDRLNAAAFHHPNPEKAGCFQITGGHFLQEGLASFDASFFNITAEEAKALDPRHRLLLECAYEALENGGFSIKSVAGKDIGVYIGGTLSDYELLCLRDPDTAPRLQHMGCNDSYLANRISYFFDLHGPSITVDTACSSSGSALHLACQSLRLGEASMAIVGAAHLHIVPEVLANASSSMLYSADGKCFPFDERVTGGFGPGEGSSCVVLKPLQDAIRAGDSIRAIIRNSGTTQNGRTLGISMPSAEAQASLIRSVYESAHIDIADTRYVEAHGTGTTVGDPIEAAAFASTFGAQENSTGPVFLGSAKSNFGHLEGASGVLSLIKTAMMLDKRVILPNANFNTPNPKIPSLGKTLKSQSKALSMAIMLPVVGSSYAASASHEYDTDRRKVPTSSLDWPSNGIRRASVNNLGFGGSNVHIIVEEASRSSSEHESMDIPNETFPNRTMLNGTTPNGTIHNGPMLNGTTPNGTIHNGTTLSETTPNGTIHNATMLNGTILNGTTPNGAIHNGTILNGTISHSIGLEEESSIDPLLDGSFSATRRLYVLTANDKKSVLSQISALASYLRKRSSKLVTGPLMNDLAFTLGQRRSVLPWKIAFAASEADDLRSQLESLALAPSRATKVPKLGFVFTGQGANWNAMGRELYPAYPVFSSTIAAADKYLTSLGAPWSLTVELSKDAESSLLGHVHISQPACTAIQLALVKLLFSWGVRPSAVIGHSSGEIAAAFAAGALTFESCMSIAYYRGLVAANMREKFPEVKGAMLAVGTSQRNANSIIEQLHSGKVVVACINSPSSITASGDVKAIADLQKEVEGRKLFSRRLHVDVAYHSPQMSLIADDYREAIGKIKPASSKDVEYFSSLLGKKTSTLALGSSYWVANLTSPVRFSDSLFSLCSLDQERSTAKGCITHLIEIGPHSALKGPIRDVLAAGQDSKNKIGYSATLVRNENAVVSMINLASDLFTKGYNLDMSVINFRRGAAELKPKVLSDLPPYSWNHEKKFWHESRIGQHHLMRMFPRSDILGSMTADSNDIELRWRNIIRLDDIPWLRHHKIRSQAVYPFTAYVAMAVEAIAQRAKIRSAEYSQLCLREISVSQALIIPEAVEVETMLALRPLDEGTKASSETWEEFRIFSWTSAGGWLQHSRGQIAVFNDRKINDVEGEGASNFVQSAVRDQITRIEAACVSPLDSQRIYDAISSVGFDYGTSFNGLSDCRVGGDHAAALVRVPDTGSIMPHQFETDLIVHPALLDNCLQIMWPLLGAGQSELDGLFIPSFAKNICIRPNVKTQMGGCLHVLGTRSKAPSSLEQVIESILVIGPGGSDELPAVVIEGLDIAHLSNIPSIKAKRGISRYSKIEWKPCLDSLGPDEFQDYFQLGAASESEISRHRAFERVSLLYFEAALQEVTDAHYDFLMDHHKKFYRSMQEQLKLTRRGESPLLDAQWDVNESERKELEALVRSLDSSGELICKVGENIPQILAQRLDVLSLMLEDGLLERRYRDSEDLSRGYTQVAMLVDIMAHENPHLRILEIGAGTGGATLRILEVLGGVSDQMPRFQEYVFTDISSGFYENAKVRVKPWGPLVTFNKLDIEDDPISQGYERESFDLIVGANVLHATTQINRTLLNVRRLLKPGGKLLLMEPTKLRLQHFPFALLPGWWAGQEEFRSEGPLLTEYQWNIALQQTGFSSGIFLQDYPGEEIQTHAVMLSTATGIAVEPSVISKDIVIVQSQQSSRLSLDTLLGRLLAYTGRAPRIVNLKELARMDVKDSHCIFLDELVQPMIAQLSAADFYAVQKLCSAPGILWVVQGAQVQSSTPESAMAIGLARCIRSENPSIKLVTLDLDETRQLSATLTSEVIANLYRTVFITKNGNTQESLDMEYLERGGRLYIPRIVDDKNMENFVQRTTRNLIPESQTYLEDNRALALKIQNPGFLDSLCFVDIDSIGSPLKPDEVEIEVKAAALNFRDVLVALGQVTMDPLGTDCAGIVTAIGSNVSDLALGDRVCACSLGALSTRFRCASSSVVVIPENTDFSVAASLPTICCTAYHSLVNIAGLCAGESILIHAAAGGVGQVAIMLSQSIGAEIYATVGSAGKKQLLMSRYGIQGDHIFFSRDLSFEDGIMTKTNKRGVDVILNSLSGEALRASWRCLAPFGRFVEIGKKDILANNSLGMEPFIHNRSYAAVNLLGIISGKPRQMKKLLLEVIKLHSDGVFKPVSSITTFPLSDVEKAFRTMASGEIIGKIVLLPQIGDRVKIIPRISTGSSISSNGTYLITGGSGGLARWIMRWLADQGAKSIILASRSNQPNEKTRVLMEELDSHGTQVVYCRCDITVKHEVEDLVVENASKMPPIRGVIHGAVVSRIALFEEHSYDDYVAVVQAKVTGAWNLHHALLSHSLDFFVSLASIVGIIGNNGQSAYAATTTFLNAFASYRASLGLAASTINLGLVTDIGFLAEHRPDLQKPTKALFGTEILEKEFRSILDASVSGIIDNSCNRHSITGIEYHGSDEQNTVWASDPKFSHMRRKQHNQQSGAGSDSSTTTKPIRHQVASQPALSIPKIKTLLYDTLAAKFSSVLMIHEEDLSADKPLGGYGMDSLVAVELRNWIARETDAVVMLIDLLADSTLGGLAEVVWRRSRLFEEFRAREREGQGEGN